MASTTNYFTGQKYSPFHYYYDDPGYTFGYGKGGWGDITDPSAPWADFRIIDPYDPNKTIPYIGKTEKEEQGLFADTDLESQVSDQKPRSLLPTKSFSVKRILDLGIEPLSLPFDPYPKTDIMPSESEAKSEALLETAEPWKTFSPRPPSTGVKQDDVFDSSRLFSRDIFNTRPGYFHTLTDPNLTGGERAGFTLSKLLPSLLGTGGSLIGLFGSIGQAMGGYHPLDQASNIVMDPFTGISRWDSPEPGGGGVQTGILNLDNQIENLAKTDPGRYLTTPYGYITAGEFDKAIKSGALHFGADLGGGQSGFEDMGFIQDKPVMLQDVGNSGDTWQRGIQDLEAGRGGAIWNQAGAIVDQINRQGGSAGYNDMQAIAEGLAMGAKTGSDMANIYGGYVPNVPTDVEMAGEDNQNIYDFDYGDLGIEDSASDSFAAAYGDWL